MKKIAEADKLILRELGAGDKTLLLKWLTDQRVLNFWEGKSAKFDLDRIEQEFYSKEDVEVIRAIIEYCGQPIGYAQMYRLNKDYLEEYQYPQTNKVVYGVDQFIGEPNFWGRGIGTEFMNLMLFYLTKQKGADIVILDPHADNKRAIRCYEKVGFKKIKFLPKHELHDGEMVDCCLMEYTK